MWWSHRLTFCFWPYELSELSYDQIFNAWRERSHTPQIFCAREIGRIYSKTLKSKYGVEKNSKLNGLSCLLSSIRSATLKLWHFWLPKNALKRSTSWQDVARRPLTVTLISDSMAKHVCRVKNTVVQAFPGISITQMQRKIKSKEASINYKYTILLVGTNNIPTSRTIEEITSYYNDLITTIKSRSSTRIIVSAIIYRPCDLPKYPDERRVKDMNKALKKMCERRNLQFLHTYRIFLYKNKPIRSYYAVNDKGLHLNLEGIRKLRRFFRQYCSAFKVML